MGRVRARPQKVVVSSLAPSCVAFPSLEAIADLTLAPENDVAGSIVMKLLKLYTLGVTVRVVTDSRFREELPTLVHSPSTLNRERIVQFKLVLEGAEVMKE